MGAYVSCFGQVIFPGLLNMSSSLKVHISGGHKYLCDFVNLGNLGIVSSIRRTSVYI